MMPLTRKTASHDQAPVDLPETPPKLPEEVRERFPSLAAWEDSFSSWWDQARRSLRRRDADLESRLTKLENP